MNNTDIAAVRTRPNWMNLGGLLAKVAGKFEKAGDKLKEAAQVTKDKIEEAARKAKIAFEKAGNDIKDSGKKLEGKITDTVADMKVEGTKLVRKINDAAADAQRAEMPTVDFEKAGEDVVATVENLVTSLSVVVGGKKGATTDSLNATKLLEIEHKKAYDAL